MWLVKEIVKQERLSICRACDYLTKTGTCGTPVIGDVVEINGETLRTCGCFMRVKASLKVSFCPLGKWSSDALTKEQACELKALIESIGEQVSSETIHALFAYKSKISGRKEQVTTCAPCVRQLIEDLKKQVRNLECNC